MSSPSSTPSPTRVFAGGAHYKHYRGGFFRKMLNDDFTMSAWESLSKGLPENVEARVIVFHPRERDVI